MAIKTVKKNKENRIDTIKANVQKINKTAIQFSDNLVEETIANGTEWQEVLAKAIKNGTTIFGKQQDLVFDTLEGVKGQFLKSNYRFRKLFSFDFPKNKKAEKSTPKVEKKIAKKVTDAKVRVSKIADKVADVEVKTKAPKKAISKTTAKKATAKKVVATKSDLKVIEGIGPKLESILNEGGILTFEQLANTKPGIVKAILDSAGPRYKMHVPTTWANQAKLAAAGKMDELKTLQAELKGGKIAK